MDNFGMTMLLIIVGSCIFVWLFRKFVEWLCYPFVPMTPTEWAASLYYWEECEEGEKND